MFKVDTMLPTNGLGYWSRVRKSVRILGVDVPYVNDQADFGELRVYFDTRTWNVNSDGLIYSDPLFIHELRHFLVGRMGLTSDVGYSEQGMQGDDYVSLDVGKRFVQTWHALAQIQGV